ncbi:MAG: hypothetical protein IJ758_03395 [Clostridia bacterium]|nr:hypothetical protein [Clostridia bacterium]
MQHSEIVKLVNEAIEKATKDAAFKEKLVKDTNAAVLELTGKELPVKVTVHDYDAKNLVFIIPSELPTEMDESDLAGVSGGVTVDIFRFPSVQCKYGVTNYPSNSQIQSSYENITIGIK